MLSQLFFALVFLPTVIFATKDFFGVFKTTEDFENNCIQYDSTDNTICYFCRNNYFLDDQGNCILIPDCINPQIKNQDNIFCEGNNLLVYSEGEFFTCPQNCFICFASDQQGLCQACSSGYALSQDQSQCFAPIDNCYQMEIVNDLLQCSSCNQGYEKFFDSNGNISCLSCSTFINNCSVCAYSNNLIQCLSCQKGYFLDDNKSICTACSDPLCVHCSRENIIYFNPITGLTGKETRESCLQCPKNYGFHYDGKSCSKCQNGCQSCFWSLNGKISYTAIWNFKAYSEDEIAAGSLNFSLTCNLTKQTCFDFSRSKIYFREFSHRLTQKFTDKHSAIFNPDYDLNHEIFGCSICSTQKAIFGRVELSSMTCLACNSNMQMYFPSNQLTQKQACSELCSKNCSNCHADLVTFKLSCLACNISGDIAPLYKNALTQLNEVLDPNDRLQIPNQNSLFLLERTFDNSSCLNCMIGCVKCVQDVQMDYHDGISKNNFQQLISKLGLDLQLLSKTNIFSQPPSEIIEMMNSRCLECQEGYQMSYPLMKCIKCEDDKLCRYFLQPIVYDLSSLAFDSTFADDYLELVFSEWNNLETFVKINQLNIQQIDITFLLGKGRFSFRDRYSLNLAFMKAGYVLTNSKVTFIGKGMNDTILALTKDFSVLFFNQVSFQSLHIDISSPNKLLIGAFEKFELLEFNQIRFSPASSQAQFGDIQIFSNLAGITVTDCEFGGVHSATSTFFKIIDVSNYLSFNFEAPIQTTIQIINNIFLSSWEQSQCFLDTSGFLSKGLDLTIDGNIFEGSFCSCFVCASSIVDFDSLDYKLRTIRFDNNVLNITLYTGSYFFRDSTADYVSLYNNTLLSISVIGMDDSSSTLFSFFQGEINNTQIGQVNASRYELYIFDITGTQTPLDIDYCIDPYIIFNNMSTIASNSYIRVFSQPLVILNESRNNKLKHIFMTNLTLFDMEFRNNSAVFNFEPLLNIELENITFYDMTLQSNFLKSYSYNFSASSIQFNRFGDSQILFSISAFNIYISSISFIDSANSALPSNNKLNQLMDITISKKHSYSKPAQNITFKECFSTDSCQLIPDQCLKNVELENQQLNSTYELNQSSNQLEDPFKPLNNEEDQSSDEDTNKENENSFSVSEIDEITIDFEQASYKTGTKEVSQVIISDIQIQYAFVSGMLFQISNDRLDTVAKIVFQNARIDQILFLDGGIGSLFSPLVVQSFLPMSFFILRDIIVTNTFAVLYNSQSEEQSKVASSSLFSIESHYFYGMNIQISNDIPSEFYFPNINDDIQVQEESVRFLEYVGQYFWLVSSTFSTIASHSGGIVKASSDSPVYFKITDLLCQDISVSKNGGILYFFTSSAADMYLWIENSSFANISAEVNGGFIDINNLYNQISLHILNCLLQDIFSNSSTIIQVKDNTNGTITFHDVEILETKLQPVNTKMIMMDMSRVNLIIVNVIVRNVKRYKSLIKADHSDILMYNVTIINSQYFIGLILFHSCSVQINQMLIEEIVQADQSLLSMPQDQVGNQIRTKLNTCNPLLQFLFCNPVSILNTSFQFNELDTCSGSIISLEQSISQIFNLTIQNTLFRSDSANYWQHSLLNFVIQKSDLINEYPQFLSDSVFTSNTMGKLSNGCIMAYNSKLIVINSVFSNNTAENGVGIFFEFNDQLENANRILLDSKQIISINPKAKNRVLQEEDPDLYGSFPWNETDTYFDQFIYDSLLVENISFEILAQQYRTIIESDANNYLIVDGCSFIGNSAVYEGGAILILNDLTEQTSNTRICVLNSNFISNTAGTNSPGISSLMTIPTLKNNTDFNNTVKGQIRTAFNIAPSSLCVLFPNGTMVDTIRNITSGQVYGEKIILSIAFLNLFDEKVYLNDSSLKQNQIRPLVYLSYPNVKIAIDSFNSSTGLIQIPAQQYINMPGTSVEFVFTSPNIFVPEMDENDLVLSAQNDYQVSLQAEFRPCVVGEICLKSKKLCILCSQGFYSLEDPQGAHCKVCPIGAQCPGGNEVLLTPGYWSDQQRNKDEVVYCLRKPCNCIGDEIPSNSERLLSDSIYFPCKEGHRGALCEVCDYRGLIGPKRYQQVDGYECEECSNLGLSYVKIGVVLCACTLFALLTVYTLISEIKNKILKNSLKILGFLTLGSSSQYFQIASSLFKILINYQQINLIVYTLDLQVPSQIFKIMASIISPFKFLQTGFDCILSSIFSEEIVFVKAIGFCLLPLGFFALLILAFAIIEILKKKIIKSYYFYASCFFITLFSVPSVVEYLALVLSCRSVGTQKFITADMSLSCYSSKHMFYLESVILPGLVIYAFLYPLLLICLLYSNKKKFEQRMFEMRFGFLYRDFKPHVFYWEIIRLMFKVIIYVSIGVLDEQLEVKALLVTLLLIVYYVTLHRVLPFQTQELNRMESLSASFNIMTMLMALLVKQIDTTYSNYFLYVFVVGQNVIFLSLVANKFYCAYRKPILRFFERLKQYVLTSLLRQEQKSSQTKNNTLNQSQEKALQRWRIIRMFLQVYQQCQRRFKDISLYSPLVIVIFSKARTDGKDNCSAKEFKTYLEIQLSLVSEKKPDCEQESHSVAVSEAVNSDKIQNDMQTYILNHDQMLARKDKQIIELKQNEAENDKSAQEDNNQSKQLNKYRGSQTTNNNLSNISSSTDNIHRFENIQSAAAEVNRLHNSGFQDSTKELLQNSATDPQLIQFLPNNHSSASRQLFFQESKISSNTNEPTNSRNSFSATMIQLAKRKASKLQQSLPSQNLENP